MMNYDSPCLFIGSQSNFTKPSSALLQRKSFQNFERNDNCRLWRNFHLIRSSLSQVHIVLVEPEGADNIGAVSRVMRNFNFSRLILVNPKCNFMEGRIRAMRGKQILTDCKVVTTLAEALVGSTRVVACTSRQRDACTERRFMFHFRMDSF